MKRKVMGILFWAAVCFGMLFTACPNGTTEAETVEPFELKVHFGEFRQALENEGLYEAPFRIFTVYYSRSGTENFQYADTALNEHTFQIPRDSVAVGIFAQVQDEENLYSEPILT